MTLSKKAVRPHQIQFLLDKGILPVSFDYRLCPETNLIDGPITDVRDALLWAQQELPSITSSQDYVIDPDQIVVIGWSTGGYLAMSTAWSSIEAGQTPPRAILSFYSPTDIAAEGKRTVKNSLDDGLGLRYYRSWRGRRRPTCRRPAREARIERQASDVSAKQTCKS